MDQYQVGGKQFGVVLAGEPVGPSDIAALEAAIGVKLPDQLRSFFLKFNGGLPFPLDLPEDNAVWVRLDWPPDSRAASAGVGADVARILSINSPPQVDFLRTWKDFKHRIPPDMLPFGYDSGGSLYVVGTGPDNLGRIYFWERSHEADVGAGQRPGYDNIAEVAPTFEEFLLAMRPEPNTGESMVEWRRRVYPGT